MSWPTRTRSRSSTAPFATPKSPRRTGSLASRRRETLDLGESGRRAEDAFDVVPGAADSSGDLPRAGAAGSRSLEGVNTRVTSYSPVHQMNTSSQSWTSGQEPSVHGRFRVSWQRVSNPPRRAGGIPSDASAYVGSLTRAVVCAPATFQALTVTAVGDKEGPSRARHKSDEMVGYACARVARACACCEDRSPMAGARKPPSRSRPPRVDQPSLVGGEEHAESFGALTRIRVRGLLGQFAHDIKLPSEEPAILTGANGTGKSTILRLVNAVGSGDWTALARLPFTRATLYFRNSPRIEIHRNEERLRITHGDISATLSLDEEVLPDLSPLDIEAMTPAQRRRYIDQRNRVFHGLDPDLVTAAAWERLSSARTGETLHVNWLRILEPEEREVLQTIEERFRVRFITDQRLVLRGDERDPRTRRDPAREHPGREPIRAAVTHYSHDLGRRISMELRRYVNASQREDRGFPQLVAEELVRERNVEMDTLLQLMDDVATKRTALEKVGLAESRPRTSIRPQQPW
jgi:hypothetical protein